MLAGCQSGGPASFAPYSYSAPDQHVDSESLGAASGISCQRYWLYLLPAGEPPSTQVALERALDSRAGTGFLVNMTVETRLDVRFGYMDECILVQGEAHRPR